MSVEDVAAVVRSVRQTASGSDLSLATRFADLVLTRLRGADVVRTDDGSRLAVALTELFQRVDGRRDGEVLVSVRPPGSVLLDGSEAEGSVVEVLSEDTQFLVTSVAEELFRLGYRVVRLFHPVLGSTRSPTGSITDLVPARRASRRESIVQLELDSVVPPARADFVVDAIETVLDEVLRATSDHDAIRDAMHDAAEHLRDDRQFEAAALVDWLESDHFVPLGCCSFVLEGSANLGDNAIVRLDHSLGLLRHAGGPLRQPVPDPTVAPVLLVARTPELSRVHRRVPVHRIDVAVPDNGRRRVFRVVGVFTRAADSEPPATIPVLRTKLESVLERHDAVPGSFDEQTITSLFAVLPRDELFCSDVQTLDDTITSLLGDDRNRRIRVLVRPDEPSRSVSVLVALPHEIYSRTLRQRIETHLKAQLDGSEVDTDLSLGNRSEALIRFLVRVSDGAPVPPGPFDDIAHEVRMLCRTWDERLEAALTRLEPDAGTAARLARSYAPRFTTAYRDAIEPEVAATDVAALRALDAGGDALDVRFLAGRGDRLRCRVYSAGPQVELSRFVPVFESLGLWVLDEVPWSLEPGDLHVHAFALRPSDGLPDGVTIDVAADGTRIADAMLALLAGRAEVDSLNRLVVAAGLSVDEVALLRAYRRYRRQLTGRYSAGYVNEALVCHPAIARDLVRYFDARFTTTAEGAKSDEVRAEVVAACDRLTRLEDDRILRGMLNTIDATLRTNRHLRPEGPLALKLDPGAVPDMPDPVPYREIFVHGVAVEGVHLRFGAVARGGLRWSERSDDYRNEVLDLARTQVLKNALIVPTGAKGGFVLRRQVPVRDGYEAYVNGLLDLTDDVRGDEVVAVPGRHDGDDPYLVVAADKGTSELSDVANQLAIERGFWLGDAFASGGSHGYDHKALGVTARGAWVAVQRHFRDLDIDVQEEPVTAVGIGDMSGDVFGNGMLRSDAIKLVAAFDHRHIFCDPEPDAGRSYAERRRLFEQPGSSWDDYDRSVLSPGGGVWSRTDKRIDLHPKVREVLRVSATRLTPPELIQAILRAPVDLLFAGGIGTFVRASGEDDLTVDDRANSDLRVEASSLRARVVGEGANLAFTPRARIEYARRGGRINLDAIDNSAGVDTSDHEVNLKILLRLVEESGEIDHDERNRLLADATESVVADAVDGVGRQCDAISLAHADSVLLFDAHVALLDDLLRAGVIDREVEAMPSRDDLDERRAAGAGFTRPELAVLLGGAKRQLRASLLRSDFPDDPALAATLAGYFPPRLVSRFSGYLPRHRLRRELIATVVTNDIVDRCGIAAVHRLADETGATLPEVVAAAWVAMQVGAIAATLTAGMGDLETAGVLAELFRRLMRSYLAGGAAADPGAVVAHDAPIASELAVVASAPADLESVPSVASIASRTSRSPAEIAQAFTLVADELGLDRLHEHLQRVKVDNRWAQSFRSGLRADAASVRDSVTLAALEAAHGQPVADAVTLWKRAHQDALADLARVRREVEHDRHAGLPGLAVLSRALRRVAG